MWRRRLARLRLPPIRGRTPSAPRYGLRGVGCLKQMLNAVFQQFDSPLQSAELPGPHDCDGQGQLKGRGAKHFDCADEFFPGDKAMRQQPDSISRLNEREMQMYVVVDFDGNR